MLARSFWPCFPKCCGVSGVDKRFHYHEKHVHDLPIGEGVVRLWDARGVDGRDTIEESFMRLIRTGFVYPYVALMPDFHPGEGSMIGSVIPTRDVILPSVVGGDLGCGVTAVQLPIPAEELTPVFQSIRTMLKERIPTGTAHNAVITERVECNPIWQREVRCPAWNNRLKRKLLHQFASLGGGNHFMEIQEDTEGHAWVMLHSGSRYLGVIIRDAYIEVGQNSDGIDRKLYPRIPHFPAQNPMAQDYLADLAFVKDFARESRKEMLTRALEVLMAFSSNLRETGLCNLLAASHDIAHNYVDEEEHFGERLYVHRKGAIRLREGEIGMIPGSMGTLSYVVEGRGNEFSFESCSHGAGRVMSRTDALRSVSEKDFKSSMEGVLYDYDNRLKDESPLAYKNSAQVLRSQKDLVRIRHELRPLLSIKGW